MHCGSFINNMVTHNCAFPEHIFSLVVYSKRNYLINTDSLHGRLVRLPFKL